MYSNEICQLAQFNSIFFTGIFTSGKSYNARNTAKQIGYSYLNYDRFHSYKNPDLDHDLNFIRRYDKFVVDALPLSIKALLNPRRIKYDADIINSMFPSNIVLIINIEMDLFLQRLRRRSSSRKHRKRFQSLMIKYQVDYRYYYDILVPQIKNNFNYREI
jgi:shikimate kinase